jgi:hypothetical protein
MAIKRFCMALSRATWLASMALITYVNSFNGSVEEYLLSELKNFLSNFPLGSNYLALPLVKSGKFDLPEACMFLSTLIVVSWETSRFVGSLSLS